MVNGTSILLMLVMGIATTGSRALTSHGNRDCSSIMGIHPHNVNNMQSMENPFIDSSAVFHFTTTGASFTTML